jgi:hypothetical protein
MRLAYLRQCLLDYDGSSIIDDMPAKLVPLRGYRGGNGKVRNCGGKELAHVIELEAETQH